MCDFTKITVDIGIPLNSAFDNRQLKASLAGDTMVGLLVPTLGIITVLFTDL